MRSPGKHEKGKRIDEKRIDEAIKWAKDNSKTLIKAVLVLVVISLSAIIHVRNGESGIVVLGEDESELAKSSIDAELVPINEKSEESDTAIIQVNYVDISGAINDPGVYSVPEGTRLFELIEIAGGLSDDADIDFINQASFVADGDKIIIPVKGGDELSLSSIISRNYTDGSIININNASKEELMQLPGVGEAIADRIIEYRTSNRFKTIEDIKKVSGIGEATFERMKEKLSV